MTTARPRSVDFDIAAAVCGHDTTTAIGAENARHDHRVWDLLDEQLDLGCTGHIYAVNPDNADDGLDIRHDTACPVHDMPPYEIDPFTGEHAPYAIDGQVRP
jgi:hypothetical protein